MQDQRMVVDATEAANVIHIRRTLIMEVIAKIAHLRNSDHNNRMRPLLQTVGEQHAKLMGGKMSQAILALISMCDASGEYNSLIDSAMKDEEDEKSTQMMLRSIPMPVLP